MASFIQFDPAKQPKCKVELHVHLDGAVRISTIWELAQKKGYDLQVKTLEDLFSACSIKRPSNLGEFLKVFHLFMPTFVNDAEAIERIAYEFCEDAHKQEVLYAEVRYSPHLLCPVLEDEQAKEDAVSALTPREVVQCVNRGLERGQKDFGLTVRSILCCVRQFPQWSEEVLQLCVEFQLHGVVGIDIVGDEETGLCSEHDIEIFLRAADLGIHRTVHAGEAGPASHVRRAVNELLAERIGHGYHAIEDPEIYHECLDKGIHFEVCPYSSYLTGSVPLSQWKHPIVRFAEDGANFSINRDDPTIIQKTLDEEYQLLRNLGLKHVHFTRAAFNAARSCFLPESEKAELLKKLRESYGVDKSDSELGASASFQEANGGGDR